MNIFTIFFDILFPPSEKERRIRSLSVEKIRKIRAPETSPNAFIEPLFTYRHPDIRILVSELKYKRNMRALRIAAELLSEEILYFLSEKQQYGYYTDPLLVPIPMHISKQRKRGWNQSALLAKRISNLIPEVEHASFLMKAKNSLRQTEVRTREDRLKNVLETFRLRSDDLVQNKDIILIDDVTTTGATISEARNVLLKAGARKVHAFTLAH